MLSKQPGSEGVKERQVFWELNNHPVFAAKAAQRPGDNHKPKKHSACCTHRLS